MSTELETNLGVVVGTLLAPELQPPPFVINKPVFNPEEFVVAPVPEFTDEQIESVDLPSHRDLRKDLQAVAETGRWNNFMIAYGKVWMCNAQDIFLTYKKKTLCFGKLAFSIFGPRITSAPFENNIFFNNHYHTFMGDGMISWGNWYAPIAKQLEEGSLPSIAMSLDELIHTYDDDSVGRCPMRSWIAAKPGEITTVRPQKILYLHPSQRSIVPSLLTLPTGKNTNV